MLIVFGIDCRDAVEEARERLVQDHLLNGIEDCYIFFVLNTAISVVMRILRLGTKETHGELIGSAAFCRKLKQALKDAVAKIPTPYESAGIIIMYLRTLHHSVKWPNKHRTASRPTETIRDTTIPTPIPTDQGGKPRKGKRGGKRGSDKKVRGKEGKGSDQEEPKGDKWLTDKPRPDKDGGWPGKMGRTVKEGRDERSGAGTSGVGSEGRKAKAICGFLVAGLLKVKRINGEVFQCRFKAEECRFRHVASLKELTRSEAMSALADSPHDGLRLMKNTARDVEKGAFKGE